MGTVHEIETAISKLSRQELVTLRDWFSQFDSTAWDKQFEEDVAGGRLDGLADEALALVLDRPSQRVRPHHRRSSEVDRWIYDEGSHSYRRASLGSTRIAFSAGRQTASSAARIMSKPTQR